MHPTDGKLAQLPPKLEKAPTVDLAPKHRAFVSCLTPELANELAEHLHVDVAALVDLGYGHDDAEHAWTVPMFDASGAIVGIQRRYRDGRKLTEGKVGVFRNPTPTTDADGVLCVAEGASDAATLRSFRYDAMAIPSAGGCVDVAAVFAKGRHVVIVGDDDKAGRDSAAKLLDAVRGGALSVRIVFPPAPHKDVRAWREAGATREEVDAAIAAARPASLGPIADAWKPLAEGLLSTAPKPRQWLFRHPSRDRVPVDDRHGDGMLPLGKVGLLASAGGVGKTMALVDAAVAVLTGRRWLGHFDVDAAVTGDVLLVLAEEDHEEVHRRLYSLAEGLGLTEAERRDIERRLVVLPFAGVPCAVASGSSDGGLQATRVVDELLSRMAGRQWALVCFDPLARVAGAPIDVDNANATFVIQQFERIAVATGATVLIAHHSSKLARREGKADSRGASAIEDGVRWVGTLVGDTETAKFQQTKSNYSVPMSEKDAVVLVRERGGRLRAQTEAEQASDKADAGETLSHDVEQGIARLVDGARKLEAVTEPGSRIAKGAVVANAKVNRSRGIDLFDIAAARGLFKNLGTAQRPDWRLSSRSASSFPLQGGNDGTTERDGVPERRGNDSGTTERRRDLQ